MGHLIKVTLLYIISTGFLSMEPLGDRLPALMPLLFVKATDKSGELRGQGASCVVVILRIKSFASEKTRDVEVDLASLMG
jgi:hypothetical protein